MQERYLNHLYSQERASATQDVDSSSTEHDYIKSLLQTSSHITKFLCASMEERLIDVAFRSDKLDPTMKAEHVSRVARVYQECNIIASIGPLLESMIKDHGASPVYTDFPASIRTLIQDQGGILINILTDEDFFEEKWSSVDIKSWIARTAKPQLREAVVSMIYEHCQEDSLKPNSNLMPTIDSNKLEITVLQKAIRDLKIAEVADKQEKKLLAFELSKVQQETFTAAFQEEERKIRLDAQDPAAWKALPEDDKKKMVTDLLTEWYGGEAEKIDLFLARETPRNPSWVKLTFRGIWEKFDFESRMKKHREEKTPLGIKTFYTTRLTPMEFYQTKKRLMEAASGKVATDWVNHVLDSKAELIWKVDREAIKKAAYVRVKTKCVPRFSAWIEVLDPCHRNLWRALDFDTTVNHYAKYDLHSPIPCPDTRAKAITEKAYGVRRSTPRDQGTDMRISQRTPTNRKPPPKAAASNMAHLKGFFEEQGRSNVRRNLNNIQHSPGPQHQQSSPGNFFNGPPGELEGLQHQAAGGAPPPSQTPILPTLPPPHKPLLPIPPAEVNAMNPTPTSLLTGLPIGTPSNSDDDDLTGLATQEAGQVDESDIETRTPVLSFTPAPEENELEDILTKSTPPRDLIATMQQNIRDTLLPKSDLLASLQDTASKIALPAKSSKLPAARKKSMSVSNFELGNLGEVSEIDDEEDDAKKSRKARMAKNNAGR